TGVQNRLSSRSERYRSRFGNVSLSDTDRNTSEQKHHRVRSQRESQITKITMDCRDQEEGYRGQYEISFKLHCWVQIPPDRDESLEQERQHRQVTKESYDASFREQAVIGALITGGQVSDQ